MQQWFNLVESPNLPPPIFPRLIISLISVLDRKGKATQLHGTWVMYLEKVIDLARLYFNHAWSSNVKCFWSKIRIKILRGKNGFLANTGRSWVRDKKNLLDVIKSEVNLATWLLCYPEGILEWKYVFIESTKTTTTPATIATTATAITTNIKTNHNKDNL